MNIKNLINKILKESDWDWVSDHKPTFNADYLPEIGSEVICLEGFNNYYDDSDYSTSDEDYNYGGAGYVPNKIITVGSILKVRNKRIIVWPEEGDYSGIYGDALTYHNDTLNETTSNFSHSRGSYIAPMRPGLRLFSKEELQPFNIDVSKYDSALLNYDSYDGKMSEPKKTIKKLEKQAKKASEYAKKHPTQSGDDGDVINPFPSKKSLKENQDFGSDDIRLSGHKNYKKTVFVHRNLNKPPYWSVRSKKTNLVIGYDTSLWLVNVTFVVQKAGRDKVRKVKQKNVHAGVSGIIKDSGGNYDTTGWTLVTYNPYINDTFVEFNTGNPVYRANEVILKNAKEVWVR